MRPAAAVLITVVAVALAVAVVEGLEDKETLVPPPEAVAEEFVRQVLAGRSDEAMKDVLDPLRSRFEPEELDDWGRKLEDEIGEIANVLAESVESAPDRAKVTALLDGSRGAKTLSFELVRENCEWMIDQVADLSPEVPAARPS